MADRNIDAHVEVPQYVNILAATICSLMVHGYIIRGIVRKYSVLNQYQNLLVIQSSVYIIGSILRFCVNRVITTDMHEVAGYHFIHIAPWIQTTLDFMLAFAEGTEGVTLMVFNVHRLLLCIRGHLIKIFYVVFIPISLLFVIFYAYVNTFYPDSSLYLCYVFFAFVSSIIVICYFILRRHFKNNGYSENVRRMQNKLSNGLLAQIFIHLLALALVGIGSPVVELLSWVFAVEGTGTVFVGSIYMIVVNMIFMWYPAAIGTTIMWSISGFLTGPAQKRSKSNISIVDLATVRRCTLEDQLARFKSKY